VELTRTIDHRWHRHAMIHQRVLALREEAAMIAGQSDHAPWDAPDA
jgi:hypothetical protein